MYYLLLVFTVEINFMKTTTGEFSSSLYKNVLIPILSLYPMYRFQFQEFQ